MAAMLNYLQKKLLLKQGEVLCIYVPACFVPWKFVNLREIDLLMLGDFLYSIPSCD